MAKHLPSQKKLIWNSVLFTLKLNTIFRSELQTRYITFHSKWYFLNCSQKDVEFSRRNFRLDPNSQLHHFKDLRFSRYSRLSTAISTSPTRKWIRMNLHSSILSAEIFTFKVTLCSSWSWCKHYDEHIHDLDPWHCICICITHISSRTNGRTRQS